MGIMKYVLITRAGKKGRYDYYIGQLRFTPGIGRNHLLVNFPQEAMKFKTKEEADAYRKKWQMKGVRIHKYEND